MATRKKSLLARQKQIEQELEQLTAGDQHRKTELEYEYSEIRDELERIDAGTWRPEEGT